MTYRLIVTTPLGKQTTGFATELQAKRAQNRAIAMNLETRIEAINDLRNDPNCDKRVAEDMFTRSRIYGDQLLDKQCVNAYSALSVAWITRDVR